MVAHERSGAARAPATRYRARRRANRAARDRRPRRARDQQRVLDRDDPRLARCRPKRLPVLWAKIVVLATVSFVLAVPAVLTAFFGTQKILEQHPILRVSFTDTGVARTVIGGALYLTVIGVFALGLGAITRNTAGGISFYVGVIFVIPPLMFVLPAELEPGDLEVPAEQRGRGHLHAQPRATRPRSLDGVRPALRLRGGLGRGGSGAARPPRRLIRLVARRTRPRRSRRRRRTPRGSRAGASGRSSSRRRRSTRARDGS